MKYIGFEYEQVATLNDVVKSTPFYLVPKNRRFGARSHPCTSTQWSRFYFKLSLRISPQKKNSEEIVPCARNSSLGPVPFFEVSGTT